MNQGGELTPQMRADSAAIDAQLRQPSREDLLRKIEALEARLEAGQGEELTDVGQLTEEQKHSKRSADAATAARARWDKREQAPASLMKDPDLPQAIESARAIQPTPPTPAAAAP